MQPTQSHLALLFVIVVVFLGWSGFSFSLRLTFALRLRV
jgi:hypothetical protein